ncbi:MAG: DUF3165 family protein [Streptococcus sp.]|nr:DUF3165 family protein [Streptococcus sp.]
MVYLIIGILIILFYIFAVPKSIKGTLNALSLVFLSVALLILFVLGVLKIFQLPAEYFVGFILSIIAFFALRDIGKLERKTKLKEKNNAKESQ